MKKENEIGSWFDLNKFIYWIFKVCLFGNGHAIHNEEDPDTQGHVSHAYCHIYNHQRHQVLGVKAGGMLVSHIFTGSSLTCISQVIWRKQVWGIATWKGSRVPAVNLYRLWMMLSEQTRVNVTKNKTRAMSIRDVAWSGYYKVLGTGKIPKESHHEVQTLLQELWRKLSVPWWPEATQM